MTRSRYLLAFLIGAPFLFPIGHACADDDYVKRAKLLKAHDFDESLPDQPVGHWLRANIPTQYEIVWGEHITDCGEATGTAIDKERDMPLCAEVELKEGSMTKGYLALLIGTQNRGPIEGAAGVYFGYLEHGGIKYSFKRLGDVLTVKWK